MSGALQFVLSTQGTQVCEAGSQMGALPGHCELSVHVATHVFVFTSHTGVAAGQSAVVRQPTHVLFGTSHTGVFVPKHALVFVAVHCTQKFSGVLQAGAAIVQFASVVQPSVQMFFCVLQIPFGPVHCAFVTHCTHSFATTLQTGSADVQADRFGAEHSTQLPDFAPTVRHAGLSALVHAAGVPEPRSPLHAMQVPAALQMGVLPEHCELFAHCTHE
jgi:hypothetical protein